MSTRTAAAPCSPTSACRGLSSTDGVLRQPAPVSAPQGLAARVGEIAGAPRIASPVTLRRTDDSGSLTRFQ